MQARSGYTFSESELGFVTFREFLEAAAKAGVVETQLEGTHLRMHVPGVQPAPPRLQGAHKSRESSLVHIPPHFWTAFVDWTPGKRRLFDKVTQTAIVFPSNPAAHQSPDESARRELVSANPDRFVEIQPLTFETQVGWMKDFADTLPDPNDRRLADLILENDPKPAYAFNVFLRRNQRMLAGWKKFRVDRALEAIRRWMNDHGVDPSVLDTSKLGSTGADTEPTRVSDSPAQQKIDQVRLRVLAAVEKMPLAELLRLPIPVEYMIESE
jgi:hypothetical protein